MAQTKAGGQKLKEHMIAKHGSEEAWKAYMRTLGSKGGANGNTGGFASDKVGDDGLTGVERAKVAGAKGGKISRRN